MTPPSGGASSQYRPILAETGGILVLAGFCMLSPLSVSRSLATVLPFVAPATGLVFSGFLLRRLRPTGPRSPLRLRDAGVIVLLSWVVVSVFSAVPFLVLLDLGLTQAVFEAVSGWTTTGLSVIDVTSAPRPVLLWRSVMQLGGGAGLAILTLAAITAPTGPGLSIAEGRSGQVLPHVRDSTRLVVSLYAGYAAVGCIAYWVVGMSPFDAVNHAFAAVSTGGFSTRPDSIGHWDSVAIEAVSLPLMLLGNLNFLTAWALLRGRFGQALRNGEVRLLGLLLVAVPTLLLIGVAIPLYGGLGRAGRVAVFQAVTAVTTTGFSTVGFGDWPALGWLVLIVVMLIGGGTGSTAGGIKQYRVYILLRSIAWEIRRRQLPRRAVVRPTVRVGEATEVVTPSQLGRIGTFASLYMASFLLGAGIMTAHGFPLREALFEFASTVGTVGLSVGVTGPDTSPGILWSQILGMLLGRLEFLVVIAAVHRLFVDARRMLD